MGVGHVASLVFQWLDNALFLLIGGTTVLLIIVAVALSRNVYAVALRTRAFQKLREGDSLTSEQQRFLRSMEAEEQVEAVLRQAGWTDIYLRRRVAVARVGHNREIDVVAVGPIILVIEVKHWQGWVWSKGSRWFQCRNRKNMDTLEFEDVQEDNVVKAAALRRYIENTRRISLPDFDSRQSGDGAEGVLESIGRGTWYSNAAIHKVCGKCIVPVVLFTNPLVKLDPATVKAKRHVFTMDTFAVFARQVLEGRANLDAPNDIRKSSFLPQWLWSCLPTMHPFRNVPREPYFLDAEKQDEVAEAVDVMRTWDLVYLHDGRLITGDLQKVEAPSAFCMYERKHILDLNIRWNSGILGMMRTFTTNQAGTVEVVLATAKRLAKKKKERKPRNAQGNIVFPLLPRRRKENDYIVMKVPGARELKTYILSDVKSIQLSHHLYENEKLIE